MPENAIIVYYSLTGNTLKIVEQLKGKLNLEAIEIQEQKKRTAENVPRNALGAILGRRSLIKPMAENLAGYDKIYLCGQIWAGNPTPPMNGFIKDGGISDKEIVLVLTHADDKRPEKAFNKYAKRIAKQGGKLIQTYDCQAPALIAGGNEPLSSEEAKSIVDQWFN